MTVATTAELLAAARSSRRGLLAFNVITVEHAEAIVEGAERASTSVILQVSQNAVAFHGGRLGPISAAMHALARSAQIDVALHLDHVEDLALLQQAPDAGYSSAMFDAGAMPYDENVAATRRAAEWARSVGLTLEAELGYVGGKPGAPANAHTRGVRTDPAEARDFVRDTAVDALAVAVGSSHAMTSQSAHLDHDLIASLAEAVPVPLVLHGSSGVADDQLRRAIRAGIVKVNVGTALNVAFTGAVRNALVDQALVDPRKYLAPAREAMVRKVQHLISVMSPSSLG